VSIEAESPDHELSVEQYLKYILLELRKITFHLEQITEENITDLDIKDQL
jgi:hypothetical protein